MSSIELMKAFDFTPEELRINQAGQLSQRQKAQLDREDFQQTIDIGCVSVVFLIAGGLLFGVCALLFNVEALLASLENILPFVLIGGGLLVVATLVINVIGILERRQENRSDVLMQAGTLTLREEEGGFNARYFLTINDHEFRIRPEMYDTLTEYPDGEDFRVYYAHRLDRIVSVEAASDYDDREELRTGPEQATDE
jgi:hypothetical protein